MNKEEQSKRTDGTPIEIEHKFLIARPDEAVLAAQPDVRILQIEQIYLPSEPGETNRVRRTSEAGEVHYYHTKKRRINAKGRQQASVFATKRILGGQHIKSPSL